MADPTRRTSSKPPAQGFRRAVANPRNSILGSGTWECLDWSNWWMDAWHTDGWRYLHVECTDKADGRIHRVYPRKHNGREVRLAMLAGVLYWLYGTTAEEEAAFRAWWEAKEDKGD